ncbi:NnrS family protein [Ideonella sp. 4Y11]|uniref:NnrS family protein n=1 Tax=Ideonella aquatica TaxID=2824119 RepID=A0A941BLN2_9BURK|nr:NnrS family protein [Ideonella aquatica]MBQ0961602.1 NnrS family protein [Ideonella aquatica]
MATVFIPLTEPIGRAPRPGQFALWALGFRPFYLLAAALAALSVPLWALQFSGWLGTPVLRGSVWHAHEMLFGFTLAVVVGFLFTAGRNWSGQPTPQGRGLMALAGLWLLGRVLVLTPWAVAALVVNVAFPLLAAWGLWRALRAGGSRRNYFFVGLLVALAVACAALHLTQMGALVLPARLGLPVALDLMMFIVAVMAGRVVPMFTNNGIAGLQASRHAPLERVALGSVLALLACDLLGAPGPLPAVVLLTALAAHTARWWCWQPWRTASNPLVWVLHLAYAWLPVHLALRLGSELGGVPPGLATHALTVGLIGGMTLGMMTRTALGHTGRPLRAGRLEVTAYLSVTAAALVRVGVPLLWPALLPQAALVSALLWSLAYTLYLWRYGPWLCRARVDGQPG